jgi:hypothetical protein
MSSWVKVSRKLLTSAIASKPEYLAVWMHLILSASYKPGEVLVGHQVIRLEAGQLVFGRIKFAQQIGVSEHTLRMALKSLETLQQITIKSHSKFSVITVTNWAKYQTDSPANNQQSASNQPASRHNKEVQEIQEDLLRNSAEAEQDDESGAVGKKAPAIPYKAIFDLYCEILPSLPQPTLRSEARKTAIRCRWQSDERFQTVEFWKKYFTYIKNHKFLPTMNVASFDWFLKAANFSKVIDGNYDNA